MRVQPRPATRGMRERDNQKVHIRRLRSQDRRKQRPLPDRDADRDPHRDADRDPHPHCLPSRYPFRHRQRSELSRSRRRVPGLHSGFAEHADRAAPHHSLQWDVAPIHLQERSGMRGRRRWGRRGHAHSHRGPGRLPSRSAFPHRWRSELSRPPATGGLSPRRIDHPEVFGQLSGHLRELAPNRRQDRPRMRPGTDTDRDGDGDSDSYADSHAYADFHAESLGGMWCVAAFPRRYR